MADAVQSFRQICWLIFKWLVIATSALAAIAVILFAAAYGYYWYTYDRHVKNVDFIVSTDRKECPEDDYPIYIIIRNRSGHTLESASFRLSARQPGRSSELVDYSSYENDHIILPNEGYSGCWWVPKLSESADPRTLQWSIKYNTLHFQN